MISSQSDEKNEDIMQSFVYEDKEAESQLEGGVTNDDQSINVFAENLNNNEAIKSDNDDEYDIPAFLRKK